MFVGRSETVGSVDIDGGLVSDSNGDAEGNISS